MILLEEIKNTEVNKSYIHCPKCDKLLIHAAEIVDGAFNRIRDTEKNQKNLLKQSLSRA